MKTGAGCEVNWVRSNVEDFVSGSAVVCWFGFPGYRLFLADLSIESNCPEEGGHEFTLINPDFDAKRREERKVSDSGAWGLLRGGLTSACKCIQILQESLSCRSG